MRHFSHLQRVIRAGLAGGDMVGPLVELRLALEAEARETRAADAREAVLWLANQIRVAKGGRREDGTVDGPTAETEAKARLSIDPVAALHRRGRIGDAELEAIGRIRRCWTALGSGLELRASRYDGGVREAGKRAVRDPADRMPDWLWLEVRHVFMPWATAQKEPVRLATRRLEFSRYELVWRIVMDATPTRRLERQQRVRGGKLAGAFAEAVAEYAALYTKAREAGKLRVGPE
ncbi:MAG: hypothetical protein IMF08_11870 [Proteobacteria bacterium]|nr:hypothetical protein [Pseudomonadota bacterium]